MAAATGTSASGYVAGGPLADIMRGALDPGYAQASRSRPPGGSGHRGLPALVALLLLGASTGVAAGQVRHGASTAAGVRRALAEDAVQGTRSTDRLAAEAAALRADVARLQDRALGEGTTGRSAAGLLAALELVTGQLAVSGPGVEVTLDNAPVPTDPAQARTARAADGRIYDRDLQDAVNALWAAGAEAVSINGQRLTALTAIRSAGDAVLVDLRPLSPPYVLRAIGDAGALEPAFADSPAARRFSTYTSLYGISFDVRRSRRLDLPAAAAVELRVARPGAGR